MFVFVLRLLAIIFLAMLAVVFLGLFFLGVALG